MPRYHSDSLMTFLLNRERLRRPPRAKEISRFCTAGALAVDLVLIGFSLWEPTTETHTGFLELLTVWDLTKGATVVAGLAISGIRLRAPLFGLFAGVLALVVAVEEITGYSIVLDAMEWVGLDPQSTIGGTPTFLYGEVIVLGALALVLVLAFVFVSPHNKNLSVVRRDLLLYLGTLFFFAVVLGFIAEFWDSGVLGFLEEVGERATMSFILGYVVGVVLVPPLMPRTKEIS